MNTTNRKTILYLLALAVLFGLVTAPWGRAPATCTAPDSTFFPKILEDTSSMPPSTNTLAPR